MKFFLTTVLLSVASIAFSRPLPDDDFLSSLEDRYIVVFKDGTRQEDLDFHANLLIRHYNEEQMSEFKFFQFEEFGSDIYGYGAYLPSEILYTVLTDPAVDYVEPDYPMYAMDTDFDKRMIRDLQYQYDENVEFEDDEGEDVETQKNAPWGISRASSRKWSEEETNFFYRKDDGKDVFAYVIDTGIYVKHKEFEGRAKWGESFVDSSHRASDENGHGTHCAGTIASKTYGICKSCQLIAVKVLDGQGRGSTSGVLAGMEWVTKDHVRRRNENNGKQVKSVVNMSLGGGKSETINRMVNAAVEAGVNFVVAAGNSADDACYYSPASADGAITVGATDISDNMARFSNSGKCVDIFAPGVDIKSTWNNQGSTNIISGTSMASPHVCGAVGALLSRPENVDITPKKMLELVQKIATKDVLTSIPDNSDNLLLFTDPNGKGSEDEEDDEFTIQDYFFEK